MLRKLFLCISYIAVTGDISGIKGLTNAVLGVSVLCFVGVWTQANLQRFST